MIRDGYQIEYIWALLLRTCQLIPTKSHSYCTLSSVSIFIGGFTLTNMDSPLWIRVGGRLTKVLDQSNQRSDQRDMDSHIVTVDQFTAAMACIQEGIANLGQRIDGQKTQQVPVQESAQFDTTILPPPPPSQLVPQAIPEIERYTGIGCPHIHLRLYSIVMRAHGLDEA